MAQLAAFRALPGPLSERLADHAIVGAYVAWGDEPDILPMFAGVTEAGPLALPHHAARTEAMDFRRWRPGGPEEKGPWSTRQPAAPAALAARTDGHKVELQATMRHSYADVSVDKKKKAELHSNQRV